MRYYCYTLGDAGIICGLQGLPYRRDFDLERRLYDPRPFARSEWSTDGVLFVCEGKDYPTEAEVYTILLYPVVSGRYYRAMRQMFQSGEMEFLPVRLVGETTGKEYGQFYIPHLLQAVPDSLAFPEIFEVRLIRSKVLLNLRCFIAPHHTHPHLLFREDVVQAMERAGLTVGLDFEPVPWDIGRDRH